MHEVKINSGDVITFIALTWKEGQAKPTYPAVLLSPVTQGYEDGIDLDTVINEALVDVNVGGKICDTGSDKFLAKRGRNLNYLKHIARLISRGKTVADGSYTLLKETYRFWYDEKGKLQCVILSH
jgi:hypothetical protein